MVRAEQLGNRELGNVPVIVDSEIPQDDSIFKEGYDIFKKEYS